MMSAPERQEAPSPEVAGWDSHAHGIASVAADAIVSIAADAIVSVDEAQRIVLFNRGAEEIFGYSVAEVMGQPLELLLPLYARPTHRAHVETFATGPVRARRMGERREIYGRRKDGTEFPAEASISKIDVEGRRFYTAVLRDVSERKRAEDERAELLARETAARAAAQRASRAREEMLGVVSHDLRNPLSAIAMCARALGETPGRTERVDQYAQTILDAADSMSRMISDLLDVASIEAGRLSVERTSADPIVIIVRAMGLFEHVADERSIALNGDLPERLPDVSADVGRVTQLLANLIGNALKFTPPGGRVIVRAAEEPNGVRVDVTDTGPGIPPDDLPYIFDRFWHAQRSAKVRGTGLGLTIARGVAEAHGSALTVESVVGRGSTFTFWLPYAESSAAPRPR